MDLYICPSHTLNSKQTQGSQSNFLMDVLTQSLLIITHFFILSFTIIVHGTTINSCSQTPFPETCNTFITKLDQNTNPFGFRDEFLKVTMNRAIKAHESVSTTTPFVLSDQQHKSAWADCLELYEDTIELVNRSISSKNQFDSQTWLSAAMTNHQTCQDWFIKYRINPSSSSTMETSNLSKLLSNSLAINKFNNIRVVQPNGRRRLLVDGFPRWVSKGDRKLLQSRQGATNYDVVVSQDGSGNYKTISEAVQTAKNKGNGKYIIYVKAGVYRENVEIKRTMKNIMIIGDGIDVTVVTASKNSQDGSSTFRSATFAVMGDGFIARDITFENTAGPQKHQAVAFRSGSDLSVLYRCSFKGYQDTLYVYAKRQFYRDSNIYGTIDFIFGDAVAFLQNCNIIVRKPMSYQTNIITAQARTDPNANTGIIVHNSHVMAGSGLQGSTETFLGRPWQKYSRTVFMKCVIDGLINQQGWLPWSGNFGLSTLYYGEYMNSGTGARTGGRVKWPGFHVITSATEAGKFTVGNFLDGGSWISASGVPFDSGL